MTRLGCRAWASLVWRVAKASRDALGWRVVWGCPSRNKAPGEIDCRAWPRRDAVNES
jgi:hypothetical protein